MKAGTMARWMKWVCIAPLLTVPAVEANAADSVAEAEPADELYRALVDEGTFTLHLRSYYLGRDKPEAANLEAWAGGGWVGYESGWIGDVLRVGVVGYTSQPIWAPEDKDGTLLLAPGQEGYSVIGQAYAALNVADQIVTGGRFLVNQPEVNPQDNRMTPNTFEGAMIGGPVLGGEYMFGYLTGMKTRNSDDFRNFAEVADSVDDADEPMWLGGLKFSLAKDFETRASAYYVPDILASTYADVVWRGEVADGIGLRLGGQAMYQTSTGDDALTGSDFDTWAVGVKADLILGWITLQGAVTQTGEGAAYNSPYGSWPGYTSMIVKDFDRAGETGWLVGATADFADFGAPGLSAFAYAVFGDNAIDADTDDDLSDNTEYDVTVDYRFASLDVPEWLKPLWLRVRGVWILEELDGDTDSTEDYRAILNYEVQFPQR